MIYTPFEREDLSGLSFFVFIGAVVGAPVTVGADADPPRDRSTGILLIFDRLVVVTNATRDVRDVVPAIGDVTYIRQ